MRIDEMHHRFEQELDRISSEDRPDFLPNERDDYLNKAIWIFLKDRYGIFNKSKEGFESNQERIDNLRTLHIKYPLQPTLSITAGTLIDLGNGKYELPLQNLAFRYLFLTDAAVIAVKDGCEKYIGHKLWQIDDIKTIYSDASYDWRRVLANFGRAFTGVDPTDNNTLGSLYFDTRDKFGNPDFEIEEVYISYIKYPNEVWLGTYNHINGDYIVGVNQPVDCDIDDAFHDEIVSIAVQQAQKDIQDQLGYQLQSTKVELDK